MSRKPRAKGFTAERELARKFWLRGLAVVRGPASGSKARRVVYPDLTVMFKGKIYVLEVKTRSTLSTIYIDSNQLEKLIEFARRAGAEAYIAIKLPGLGWRFVKVNKLEKTGKNYKLNVETIASAPNFDEFVNMIMNVRLDKYYHSEQSTSGGEQA